MSNELKSFSHYAGKMNKGVGRIQNVFMESGKGSYMIDKDGTPYLDFIAGIGVVNLGHSHPRLVEVVKGQAEKLWHGQTVCGIHAPMAELMDELDTIVPRPLSNYFFCTTGAESVEGAVRAARTITKRQAVFVMQGSFHGRTNACLSMTTSKYVYGVGCGPKMPGVQVAPVPYTTQLKLDPMTPAEEMSRRCLGVLEDLLSQTQHPSEVAMIIAEPCLGEGGYLPLPVAYLKGLRTLCDKYGIILALDEVQTGFGRTGTMFAVEQTGVVPDILLFAKGIANGLPIAGFATTKKLGDMCTPGTQGGTYGGNALACASAAEVIRIFRDEHILDNVIHRGQQLWQGLEAMIKRNNFPIQEVRGRGLLIGIQFRDDVPAGVSGAVAVEAYKRKLLLLNTSKFETLRLIPPLTVTKKECDEALAILEDSIIAALRGKYSKNNKVTGFVDAPEKQKWQLRGWKMPCRRVTVFENDNSKTVANGNSKL